MDEKEALEKTKELTKVNPVAEPVEEEKPTNDEFKEEAPVAPAVEDSPAEQPTVEEEKEYDPVKHNRLMMEFDANEIDEESPKNIKESRRNVTLLALLGIGIISVIVLLGYYLSNKSNIYDYEYYTNQSIIEIYNNQDNTKLKEVLTNIKDNKKAIEYLHTYIKEQTTRWTDSLVKQDYNSKEEFQKEVLKVKQLIELIKNTSNDDITTISTEEYKTITERIKQIEEAGTKYYEGIDLYNNKDYNEAYHIMKDTYIESEFYTKSLKIEDQIMDSFFEDLQKELDNIQIITEEDNLIALNLLKDYITKYNYLQLDKNEKYKEIMKRYQG